VEIKARLSEFSSIQRKLARLTQAEPALIEQEDVFFHTPQGRLKLRIFSESSGELIYYQRQDEPTPKESQFMRAATSEPEKLRETLSAALGVRGIVRKVRMVYLVGQTRVHLDEVEGLGKFIELEVMLDALQTVEQGAQIANELMLALGIAEEQLVDRAYIDLLEG